MAPLFFYGTPGGRIVAMKRKDLTGGGWLNPAFLYDCLTKSLSGKYEGYSALQTFLPGTRESYTSDSGEPQRLCGAGYRWLSYQPMEESFAVVAFYDPQGQLLRWYFDISRRNYLDEQGVPCRDDLYLDLVILPDGRAITKDADELREALDKGDITARDYDHAWAVQDHILGSRWRDVDFLTTLSNTLLRDYAAAA